MSVAYTEVLPCDSAPAVDLTIVTICRNVLPELKQTLESVLHHKAKNTSITMEHVVVDGASTDGTPEWLAEQAAAGNLERYVSEPDAGIYDAMNKGINMARGVVIAFLNAGDTYLPEADLTPCVRPIAEGRTHAVAAWATNGERPIVPCYDTLLFVYCPSCHQSYFLSTALCRRLGGYDVQHFRSAGDTDLMYRVYREAGLPMMEESQVAYFAPGGFSAINAVRYWDEILEIYRRCWDMCLERAGRDKVFHRLHITELTCRCRILMDWQAQWRPIPEQVAAMRQMLRDLAALRGFPLQSLLMRLVAALPMRQLEKGPRCSLAGRAVIWAAYLCGALPKAHPMAAHRFYARPTLGFYLGKLLRCR